MERIRFEPVREWRQLRSLRGAVANALAELPEPVRAAMVIAANELVENGLLHSDAQGEGQNGNGSSQTAVTLELVRSSEAIELSVTTPLRSVDRASIVLRLVEEVESATDRQAAYVERLLELARAEVNTTSKLGFHRVALEGGCSLQAVHRNDLLTVRARRALP